MSHVFEPSPQGVLRVDTLRFLVGMRTGPLTRSSLLLARSMSSLHTFSSEATLRLVRVMRILWIFGWSSCDVFFGSWNDMLGVVGMGSWKRCFGMRKVRHDCATCQYTISLSCDSYDTHVGHCSGTAN